MTTRAGNIGSIFHSVEDGDVWLLIVATASIFAVVLLWELLQQAMNRFFTHRHKHLLLMFNSLIGELGRLGINSFSLFLLSIEGHLSEHAVEVIKAVHLSIAGQRMFSESHSD